jgi:hypothetical protein
MPYERHTTRHAETIFVEHDKELFDRVVKDRWHVYENRPIRDVSELFIVMRKVANSHESRLSAIRGLMEKHPKLIVFYNFDYELEILRTLCSTTSSTERTPLTEHEENLGIQSGISKSGLENGPMNFGGKPIQNLNFEIAEWNGHKHQEIPETDRWVYLVQYVAGSEGWNCVATDAMVFYSLTYSYKNFHQAHGRIDRLNTTFTDLHYYTLVSKSLIDRAVMGSLRKKKSFNESKFAKVLG